MHTCAKAVIEFLVVGSMPMELVGLTICRHESSKCCIWLDAELRGEFNGIKIIFIGQSMRKLRPTQRIDITPCTQWLSQFHRCHPSPQRVCNISGERDGFKGQ